jgi:polysaccharide export outer membrane protein
MGLVTFSLLPQSRSFAQQSSDSATTQSLIEALDSVSRGEQFPGIIRPGQLLDSSRKEALEAAAERAEGRLPMRTALTVAETEAFARSCRGTLDEQTQRVLDLIPQISRLERDFCRRLAVPVFQVGYETFQSKGSEQLLTNGALGDDFVLGIGDELVVTTVGAENNSSRVKVDREGRVTPPRFAPIAAAGRTLGDFRRDIERRVKEAFVGTEVFVSLGSVRQVSVLVVGELQRPGVLQVTALSSVVDAIMLAGGIRKTGSLRRISVIRNGQAIPIDLYELLFGEGGRADLTLRDGDRIVVPTIGGTIAVAGDVIRPGIFEIGDDGRIAASEAIRYAGDAVRPRGNRYVRIAFDEQGKEVLFEEELSNLSLGPGDVLMISRREDVQIGGVDLQGHVRVKGRRTLRNAPTVAALLGSRDAFLHDPYLPFGVIETTDHSTKSRQFFGINLQWILDGVEDFELRNDDRVIALSKEDVRYLASSSVQRIIRDGGTGKELRESNISARRSEGDRDNRATDARTLLRLEELTRDLQIAGDDDNRSPRDGELAPFPEEGCQSLKRLSKLVRESQPGRFSGAALGSAVPEAGVAPSAAESKCNAVFEAYPDLLPFVLEHAALALGEVRQPGVYPVVPKTSLASLVRVAEGLTRNADIGRTELSAPTAGNGGLRSQELVRTQLAAIDGVAISPGDIVRFNTLFSDRESGPVHLEGEFRRPGVYEIRRGERLSEVVARAGGLTAQAYPYGAFFTREGVRRAEEQALRKLARELNAAVAVASATRNVDAAAFQTISQLTGDVAETPAIGRVVIEADPTVLQIRPELDVVLQPGDRLIMPKRPNSVLVVGDVLNPGAQQFIAGTRTEEYIRQAGGFQQSADSQRVFVVFPNGVAQPVSTSPFNYTPIRLPPGSSIVVPRDATPFDALNFARDISSVLSQLAIAAASLVVISNN